jgi:hypothetical protein
LKKLHKLKKKEKRESQEKKRLARPKPRRMPDV